MKLKDFIRPASMELARATLKELGDEGIPIAGATVLHFMDDRTPKVAVDLMGLGLSGIHESDGKYRIGATTSLADIMHYRAENWAFHEITRKIATHQIRNISTIGGNIARVFPWNDLPVALLAMDATMIIQSDEEISLTADEFFKSQPARLFETGDILTAIEIPVLGPGMGYGSHKEVRSKSGFSVMTGCAVITLDGEKISNVRVATGGATPLPRRTPKVEDTLIGQKADAGLFSDAVENGINEIKWLGREGFSAEYARHLAGVVLTDCLTRALEYAQRRSQ